MVTISTADTPADFEEAMAATGYGRFNLLLMLIAWPCCMSAVYESACISYIIPIAECDLQLSLLDKGILNAIAYAGLCIYELPRLSESKSTIASFFRYDYVGYSVGILCGPLGTA